MRWSGKAGDDEKKPRRLGVMVGTERIESDTEFVILGSTGIWEVRLGKNVYLTQVLMAQCVNEWPSFVL